jgi:hypothetical protein
MPEYPDELEAGTSARRENRGTIYREVDRDGRKIVLVASAPVIDEAALENDDFKGIKSN